jgi:ribosomal protein S18 acetylase RimI-like enzyme
MTISAVRTAELGDAFGLLYGPSADLPGRLADAFRRVARGELNPDDLLVARRGDHVTGAVYCQRLPGAIAVIWPPRAGGDDLSVEDELTTAALEHVDGSKVVQAFLPPEEVARAAPLIRAGFRNVTRVLQMRRDGNSAPSSRGVPAPPLVLVSYPECDATEFLQILTRSHDDSLDCPELHGVRTPAEMFEGYRDCAPEPARWWLARQSGEAVGVLILAAAELTFVGVVPDQRGRGIGRALVQAACTAAPVLSVTVDVRNHVAVQLYRSVGFEPERVSEVYLRLQGASAGARLTHPTSH